MHNPKEVSGRRAAELVRDGMVVGLGTGSTVYFSLVRLRERIEREGLAIRGVPTSNDTDAKARALGIPLVGLEEVEVIDLTIDGADEIDANYDMIKGGGGALLREKVVASLSREEAIVVGPDKLVDRLGSTFPLPIEVVPFAVAAIERRVREHGAEPRLRMRGDAIFVTDNGNHILDCRFARGIADAAALEQTLDRIPGIVETGLFIGLAHTLVIGHPDGRVDVRNKRG